MGEAIIKGAGFHTFTSEYAPINYKSISFDIKIGDIITIITKTGLMHPCVLISVTNEKYGINGTVFINRSEVFLAYKI